MAQIRSIDLDEDGLPKRVTLTLSRAEVLFIAVQNGRLNSIQADEMMVGGAVASTALYESITGDVINRYWDGGTEEAVSEL